MERSLGSIISCGIILLLILLLLPILVPIFVFLLILRLLTGRRVVYMGNYRPFGPRPSTPERDPEAGQQEREFRASEAIIDAEVVDIPDAPPRRIGEENDERP